MTYPLFFLFPIPCWSKIYVYLMDYGRFLQNFNKYKDFVTFDYKIMIAVQHSDFLLMIQVKKNPTLSLPYNLTTNCSPEPERATAVKLWCHIMKILCLSEEIIILSVRLFIEEHVIRIVFIIKNIILKVFIFRSNPVIYSVICPFFTDSDT